MACRCEPRCHNRPRGYSNEMIPYWKMITIRSDKIEFDTSDDTLNTVEWKYHISSQEMHQIMFKVGLCMNGSKLFYFRLSALFFPAQPQLYPILKHCRYTLENGHHLTDYTNPCYYKEGISMREQYTFILFALSFNFIPDIISVMKRVMRQLIWHYMANININDENRHYYWLSDTSLQ